ncbi:DUF6320 domain-containing protein [Alkalibacterium sp. MB6]|uniref:DUF6320 domain-containing protein n=1 Tax=Alkalibacterium sp. MB6 TaxID=2081965 RepID=UPI001F26668E|nr:DUF6320 domain-containing protein [Alkalibacterium sp. MB6]
MLYCNHCEVSVEGEWSFCPLCQQDLTQKDTGESEPSAFLSVPLRFTRKRVKQAFMVASIVIIVLYLLAYMIWNFRFFGLEYVLFGLMSSWLMVLVLIRKRRNIVKGITYLLFILSLLSLYLDYVDGWRGWSVTFAIPIVCIAALLAMFLAIQIIQIKAGDYVLYLQLAAIVGLIPLLFLLMGWARHPLPSSLSVLFSFVMFLAVLIKYGKEIRKELGKRMHI